MSYTREKQPFWEIAGLPAPGTRLSADEYLALPETMTRMELIDGKVVYPFLEEITMSPTPRPNHQRHVSRLDRLIASLVPNGEVLVAPMDVRLGSDTVQPDVFWIAEDGRCLERETYFEGAPDLVIEVLSPSTSRHDRTQKFDLYERHGVREYWLVDPVGLYIEVYVLHNERFVRHGAYGPDETFVSPVLNDKVIIAKVILTG